MVARFLATAAAAMVLSASTANAQSGRMPAELPPVGYDQTQYVDSNGCVFIRAGYDGNITWVPRYGDDRRPMCGFQPSLGGGAGVQTAQASQPAPAQTAPVRAAVTLRTPSSVTAQAATPAPAPQRAPQRVRPTVSLASGATRIPFSVPPQTRQRPAASLGAGAMRIPYSVPPETDRRQAAAPRNAPQARVYQAQSAGDYDTRWSFYDRTGPSPCTNYSPFSQLYAVPSPARPDLPLRCGPQAEHPADALREQSPNGGRWVPWDGATPAPGNNVYVLPPPYAPRWPQPYLQGASQTRRVPATTAAPRAPRVSVSTMGTTRPTAASGHRGRMSNGQYVQIGTFGVQANARATIGRLQSNGMPVATGHVSQGGRELQVVLAGPFNSSEELNAALGSARRMGYRDAFVR